MQRHHSTLFKLSGVEYNAEILKEHVRVRWVRFTLSHLLQSEITDALPFLPSRERAAPLTEVYVRSRNFICDFFRFSSRSKFALLFEEGFQVFRCVCTKEPMG